MSNKIQFGETSWETELKNNNGGQGRNKDLYMKFDSGENLVRIVTKPYEYSVHVIKENENDIGDKVMCSVFHGSCTCCADGNKSKRRWLVGIIDRRSQSYKILDIGPGIFKSVQEFQRDEDYGAPTRYDINIKVDKQAAPANYYTVIPKPPKAMSASDIEIMEAADTDELMRKVTPPTPEKMAERLKAIRDRKNNGNGSSTKTASVASAVKAQEVKANKSAPTVSDDSEFTFPSASV